MRQGGRFSSADVLSKLYKRASVTRERTRSTRIWLNDVRRPPNDAEPGAISSEKLFQILESGCTTFKRSTRGDDPELIGIGTQP